MELNVLMNYIIKTVYGEGIINGVLQVVENTPNIFVLYDLLDKFELESQLLCNKYMNLNNSQRKDYLLLVENAFHKLEFGILTCSDLSDNEIYSCKNGLASISEGIKSMIVKLNLDLA